MLAIQEKSLGTNDAKVANTLDNLGDLYAVLHKFRKAELVTRRVLTFPEGSPGISDMVMMARLERLAAICCSERNYAEAEPLMKRDLSIRKKCTPIIHPRYHGDSEHCLR